MKIRGAGLLLGITIGVIAALIVRGEAHAGYWIPCWSRLDARSYAYSAVNEPYDLSRWWWTNDDIPYYGTEGTDCSSLVYKSWAMPQTAGQTQFWYWSTNEQGADADGYHTSVFFGGCSGGCPIICGQSGTACGTGSYSLTDYSDAFVTYNAGTGQGHVALIYTEDEPNGRDRFIDAVSSSTWQRQYQYYRTSNGWRAIKRVIWGCQ